MCAGQGRDLIDVLGGHPRRAEVTARLVELDPRIAAAARQRAAAAGLSLVDVVTGDAGLAGAYAGLAPADLVLACGVFGNITAEIPDDRGLHPAVRHRRHGHLDQEPPGARSRPADLPVVRGA